MIKVAVHIQAPHDPNGNPRRGWVIYDQDERYLGFINEGNRDPAKLGRVFGVERSRETGRFPGVIEIGDYEVSVSTYREHNKDSHAYNNGLPVKW